MGPRIPPERCAIVARSLRRRTLRAFSSLFHTSARFFLFTLPYCAAQSAYGCAEPRNLPARSWWCEKAVRGGRHGEAHAQRVHHAHRIQTALRLFGPLPALGARLWRGRDGSLALQGGVTGGSVSDMFATCLRHVMFPRTLSFCTALWYISARLRLSTLPLP